MIWWRRCPPHGEREGKAALVGWDAAHLLVVVCGVSLSLCVCVNSATGVLGLSHDGLPRHRAGLPAHLGAAVNKVKELPYNSSPKQIVPQRKIVSTFILVVPRG